MGFLFFVIFLAIIVIVGGILGNKKDQEKKATEQKEHDRETLETVALIRQGLIEKNDANSNRIDIWKEWHSQHEYLGEPTEYVGFSDLHGWPWERPKLNLKFDDTKSPSEQLDDALSGDTCLIPYQVPDIRDCAMFYKDARIAFIGGKYFTPEEIRFVKSRTDKELKKIVVTVTTTNLDAPTFSMLMDIDRRDDVDELKAAIIAFKALK